MKWRGSERAERRGGGSATAGGAGSGTTAASAHLGNTAHNLHLRSRTDYEPYIPPDRH
jgi:hypothetical protein